MPQSSPDTQGTVQQMSLKEYAAGAANVMRDLQRQTDAYDHFQSVIIKIQAAIASPKEPRDGLPFISVNFPVAGDNPAEAKLDVKQMDIEQLTQMLPVFIMLEANAGKDLLSAWERLQKLTAETAPYVAQAREAMAADPAV